MKLIIVERLTALIKQIIGATHAPNVTALLCTITLSLETSTVPFQDSRNETKGCLSTSWKMRMVASQILSSVVEAILCKRCQKSHRLKFKKSNSNSHRKAKNPLLLEGNQVSDLNQCVYKKSHSCFSLFFKLENVIHYGHIDMGCRKTFSDVRRVLWNHFGPSKMH